MGRTAWDDVPAALRAGVEDLLGSPVTTAVSQAGGWSPGGADRVRTEAGRRAFVKTLSRATNPDGYGFHEQEARVMAHIPASVQAPALLGTLRRTVDGDDWIALVLEDVDGGHPGGADVGAVLDALDTLPVATGPLAELPRAAPDLAEEFGAWDRMLPSDTAALPPDVAAAADRFAAAARGGATAADGGHLVHLDCRADNLLVDRDGVVWVVDWPWAGVGAHWLDPLTYLLDTVVRGEDVDVEHHVATHPVFDGVPSESVDAVLAGLAGMFLEKASRPAPPGMPTIRAFQRTEGEAAARWFLRRQAA
ncbi:phosphotransferase [Curtobacterium sp. 9128]|uniref:phosphotransferase n=1 Tax=Curtobacterium sp. 9128 TaxID=1793722 RepID=UPI0016427627|nr:phosphotransferase [Curtobacterium sp. 9128]